MSLILRTILFAIITVALTSILSAEKPPDIQKHIEPEIAATKVNPHAPIIDGYLNDPVWLNSKMVKARDFIQLEPDEGHYATESTLVAIAYDEDAVYFAFWCYDHEPEKVTGQLVRRDRWSNSDKVTIRLDPFHDHQTGYYFEVSVAGVQRDFRIYNDSWTDDSWDGVWESASKRQPWGYSVEIKIPFYCLRFPKKEEHTWGMNVTRYIPRKDESDWWAFSPSSEGGMASQFGHLTNLIGIVPGSHLEILPYAVTSLETEPKSSGNPDGRDYYNNVGFDLKYGLTTNLTLDMAVNPDFGQVELDDPVLNLSVFETWYNEKRPFFLEGADIFSTNYTLFYSRRIGRQPRGINSNLNSDDIDYFTEYPSATSILGAAKLTGKLESGTAIGLLTAFTDEEIGEYVTADGNAKEDVVEPKANYSVFRLKQDVFKNSHIGVIGTYVGQDTKHPEYVGAFDYRLCTSDAAWHIDGQFVFSRVDGENTGWAWNGDLISKDAGTHWVGSIGGSIKDPNFDISGLGFTPRNDLRHSWAWVQYRTRDQWFIVRNSWHNLNFSADWNYAGLNIQKGGNYNFWIEFDKNWGFGGGIEFDMTEYDDLETRGYGDWQYIDDFTWAWWANLESDQSKMFSIILNPGSGTSRGGTWWAHYTGLEFRPKSNIELEIGTNIRIDRDRLFWVDNLDETNSSNVFARLDRNQITPGFSANMMFHKNLSLQFSGEALIAGLDYKNPQFYRGGRVYEDAEEISEDEYDYNYTAINTTLILRWEYLPGSTLYLVWTRAMDDFDDSINNLDINRDLDRLFSSESQNVFLIKASYWWNI